MRILFRPLLLASTSLLFTFFVGVLPAFGGIGGGFSSFVLTYPVANPVANPVVAGYLSGKDDDLEGIWEGIITREEGGKTTEFKIKIVLEQKKGKTITGYSTVYYDKFHAKMSLKGELMKGGIVKYEEIALVDKDDINDAEWCIKQVALYLHKEKGQLVMDGLWQGKTSFSTCVPGRIVLKKVPPRA